MSENTNEMTPREKAYSNNQAGEMFDRAIHEMDKQVSFFKEKKFISKRLGDEILKEVSIKTLTGNDRMYVYENGYYIQNARETIKEKCSEKLREKYSSHCYKETISYLQSKTYTDPEEINNDWINLENGLLNPITQEFIDHTPEVFSTIRIPIKYDPEADCPLWKQKLKEKINGSTIDVLQEMFGYCYHPSQKFEVAFLFYGKERTMKSTTLSILAELLGKENVTAHSLQYLTEDKFGMAYLYGKPANICADLSSKALRDTGTFMTLTGQDKISAAKKREHPISFNPTTKLIFSCNDIPPTTNKHMAFYRRWIILRFDEQTQIDDIDPNLREKLEKELSGILNWSLEGLNKLISNNKFSYLLTPEEVKDLYERSSNSIQSFIYNKIDMEDDDGKIKKREVFKAYKEYCETEELKQENHIKFGRDFIALTGCGTCKKDSIPAYQGISFNEYKPTRLIDY